MAEIIQQFFDERLYIESYPDVAAVGINPWEHFRRYGIGERRQFSRLASPSDVEKAHGSYTTETISRFLVDFLAKGGNDADEKLSHAMQYGAGHPDCKVCDEIRKRASKQRLDDILREHKPLNVIAFLCERMNSLEIDLDDHLSVADYVQMYPDVIQANVNAYYHYYTAGRAEGRRNRLSVGTGVAKEFQRLISHGVASEAVSRAGGTDKLAIKLIDANADQFYVLLSHDNPLENLGGIQQVVTTEFDDIAESDGSYMHIFPEFPKANFEDNGDTDLSVGAVIDGTFCGYMRISALIHALRTHVPIIAQLRIHHLFGQNRHTLDLLALLPVRRKSFVIHDHSFLCDGYHLLRNNLTYCGAPSSNAPDCKFCVHGSSRQARHGLLARLVNEHYELSAPSRQIIDVCKKHNGAEFPIELVPHWIFSTNKQNAPAPVRHVNIAYCGFDVYHKGYDLFLQTIRNNNSELVNYHYLGAQRPADLPENVTWVQVRSPHLAAHVFKIELIRRDIHLVLMPSRCPESFGFIAHEAKAAGCLVIVSEQPSQPVAEVALGGKVRSVTLNNLATAVSEETARILRDGFIRQTLAIQFQSSLRHDHD